MRFFNFGLVTLSGLFATGLAAPTAQGEIKAREIANVEVDVLGTRAEQVIFTKIQTTIVEVKKHTSVINSTVEEVGACGPCAAQKKEKIVSLVKSEITIVVGLIHALVGEVVELLSDAVEIVEEDKQKIVGLVLELIFEIIYTIQSVLKTLSITIFELLGPLVFVLLTVIGHLLTTLNVLVEGLLQLVFQLLGSVIHLLVEVLAGLLPTVLGIVGGVLSQLDLGGLICGLLN
ncbi:hypothetical protein CSOJ01_14910 [Colletotrichum sojae]|uniref:Uncharacterized protein n=1 Tax=Colletotrichum sojae TaxID=2175907 RepID=A0A8H6MJK4_9PEZI|nr:hypothetical protein CSOJ01_14910 [Colletotrichum sojae]